MAKPSLLAVDDAVARATAGLTPLPAEDVPLAQARGRVLARDLEAGRTQPPHAVSAMDGYAVRHQDVSSPPARLEVVGAAPAGHPFSGSVGTGQAVRIFTGGVVPDGADAIVIQENTRTGDGSEVEVLSSVAAGLFVRPKGLDFSRGDRLLRAGMRLGARDIALAAAMNCPVVPVRVRPRVAVLATGDELVPPGHPRADELVVSSNSFGVIAALEAIGAEAVDLGIAPDDRAAIAASIARAADMDIIVTIGGASVGEHDLVREGLSDGGLSLDFWRIAMRPGKPLMVGSLGRVRFLGLPGNPVSALVCTQVFLKPMVYALLGLDPDRYPMQTARLGADVAENDERQDYLRATLSQDGGILIATPFPKQDSSMLARLQQADCFVVRPPRAAALRVGEQVPILPVDG